MTLKKTLNQTKKKQTEKPNRIQEIIIFIWNFLGFQFFWMAPSTNREFFILWRKQHVVDFWYYFIELNDCLGYSYFSESLVWEDMHQEIILCKAEETNLASCSSFFWCAWLCFIILFSLIYVVFLFHFHPFQISLFLFFKVCKYRWKVWVPVASFIYQNVWW